MLHPLVRWLGRRCLRWFYRDRCVFGQEHLPATGPVLLIGNHPNDIPDVLLGYLSTPRPIRYVGTISGATSPIARATYRGLGVIPVTRVRDARKQRQLGVDAAATNEAAFQSVTAALNAGAMVAVFPEGGVTDEPSMGQFRGGVAKMALDCIDNVAQIDLAIVPIGVHYDGPRTPATDITVVIGPSFSLRAWLHGHTTLLANQPAHPAHRANTLLAIALRNRMREALATVTRNAPSWELAAARDTLAALVGALLPSGDVSPLAAAAQLQHDCAKFQYQSTVNPTTAHVGEHPAVSHPASAERAHIVQLADSLSAAVSRAGALPVSARDCARVLHAAGVETVAPAWPSLTVIVLSAPLALVGLSLHAPVLAVIWRHAHRIAADRAELVGKAFVAGVFRVLLWYAALSVALAITLRSLGISAWFTVPAALLLPTLGDLGAWWRNAVNAWRLRAKVSRWPEADRAQVRAAAESLRAAWARHSGDAQSPA